MRAIKKVVGPVVLVFQGGGALGAYHAGVYEALHEAGMALVLRLQQIGAGVSNCSAQRCAPLSASMSWALTLTSAALGCTEPSSTYRTPKSLPMALASTGSGRPASGSPRSPAWCSSAQRRRGASRAETPAAR